MKKPISWHQEYLNNRRNYYNQLQLESLNLKRKLYKMNIEILHAAETLIKAMNENKLNYDMDKYNKKG